MTESLPSLDSTACCAVCGDERINGRRYGASACLGCIMFFRRAIKFRRKFICERDGHCSVMHEMRCCCRACRLQKCFDVGMQSEAFHPRDSMGPRTKVKQPAKTNDGTSASAKESVEINIPAVGNCCQLLMKLVTFQDKQYSRHRLLFDAESISTSLYEQLEKMTNSSENKPNVRVSPADIATMARCALLDSAEWIERFEIYHDKSIQFRTIIAGNFSLALMLVDQGYQTSRQTDADVWVLQNGSYIPVDFERDLATIADKSVNAYAKLHPAEMLRRAIEAIADPMRLYNIDKIECAALKQIILFSYSSKLPYDQRKRYIDERSLILDELYRYCHAKKTNENTDDGAIRFGNLLLILQNIHDLVTHFVAQIHMDIFFELTKFHPIVRSAYM